MSPYESDLPERPAGSDAEAMAGPPIAKGIKRARRRRLPMLLLAIAVAAVVVGAFFWWLQARQWESTDDAFIDVHMVQVAPQVAGRIARVLVDDNQLVKPGDVLVEIDPANFQASLDQTLASQANAAATLAQAQAQQEVDRANAEQSLAQIGVAQANAQVAEIQLKRDRAQAAAKAISSQQLDNSIANAQSSAASLAAAKKKHASDEALLAVAASQIAAAKAGLEGAKAQVAQARLDLSYTRIVATESGRIAHKNVSPGSYVQVGQNLMALVPLKVWVTANFKETQLDLMRVGQPVEIRVDAYPDRVFKGHVDSFQPGSGAAFSLLPPENATGNYVKVVQRVPVKIVFDDPPDLQRPLGPGMSVVPSVKVR
jgi:membrane fusion protein (multidrug efflux system)